MLMEYANRFYLPALENYRELEAGGFSEARELSAYLAKIRSAWHSVSIRSISSDNRPIMERGDKVTVKADVSLGSLSPKDVCVELYHGAISSQGDFVAPARSEMEAVTNTGDLWEFGVTIMCSQTGRQGQTVRILPKHQGLVHPFIPGLIKWA
jgi:starch phosphorylase